MRRSTVAFAGLLCVTVVLAAARTATASSPDLVAARVDGTWTFTVTTGAYTDASSGLNGPPVPTADLPPGVPPAGSTNLETVAIASTCARAGQCVLTLGLANPDRRTGVGASGFTVPDPTFEPMKQNGATYQNDFPGSGSGPCQQVESTPRFYAVRLTLTVTDAVQDSTGWRATAISGDEATHVIECRTLGAPPQQLVGHLSIVKGVAATILTAPSTSVVSSSTVAKAQGGSAAPPSTAKSTPTQSQHSSFLDIPSPGQALTLKNVALAAALSIVLMLLVLFPSTLFNRTLEANLTEVRNWFPPFMRARPPITDAAGKAIRRSYWHTWPGFVTYMLLADLLYSLTQPGWGVNRATAHTFIAFVAGTAVTTSIGITMTRTYLRRRGAVTGHMQVEVATLSFAGMCVAASRLARFVPGYFYGVIAAYIPSRQPTDSDRGRMSLRSVGLTYILAIGAWCLFGPLKTLAAHGGFFGQLPLGIAGGMVTGGVQAIVIGLVPLVFLPGHVLKKWNPRIWAIAYLGGGFLFSLVLLRPGLVNARESSVAWTVALAAFFAVASFLFWFYFRQRTRRLETKAV